MARFARQTFFLVALLVAQLSLGQGFSEDPIIFAQQATHILRSSKTEAYIKVAADFQSAWDTKFKQEHKEKLITIAQGMRARGYVIKPHFDHLFAYLANAVVHEGVQADQLNKILDINLKVLKSLNRPQYANFLFEMSTFFGSRQLHRSNNVFVQANGGSYSFELIGDAADEEIDEVVDASIQPEDNFLGDDLQADQQTEALSGDGQTQDSEEDSGADDWGNDDSWGSNDSWDSGGDDWGSNDSWDTGGDDWGSNDSWDTGGDDWGSDDSWGTEEETSTEPEPERPDFTPVTISYVTQLKSRYAHPKITGPVLHLDEIQLLIVTPYDSFQLKKVEGEKLLKSTEFAGTSGQVVWPGQNEKTRAIEVTLGEFTVPVHRGDFWTPNATMKFPGKFEGETEGAFYFRSETRNKGQLSSYPRFISYENDVQMNIDDRVSYKGGVKVQGNKLYGASVNKKRGVLTILDGSGRKAIFRSPEFAFADSSVTAQNASVTLQFDGDSIHHPSVQLRYEQETGVITMLRNKGNDVTPFVSTYHGVSFRTELIKWYTEGDSINMSTMQGKQLVPTTFESLDYFNKYRYKKLSGIFTFHPIAAFVFYAKKYNTEEFYIDELVTEYEIARNMAEGAARQLDLYGFAKFDASTGYVVLFDKAFHYYESAAKMKDFDNLMIPSISPDKVNATLLLDSMQMKVHGVDRFFVTTDFQVEIIPKDGDLILNQNRQVVFDGQIKAGEFDYTGRDFAFDYGGFLINMPSIDSIAIEITPSDSAAEGGEAEPLKNKLTGTSGTLYLDKPSNKSGKDINASYPYFASESDALVYFDGPEILNGAYDKSVFFLIPPLELDSIEKDRGKSLIFPGTFNSGGIFPDFEDTLSIMDDNSLGFVHHIPPEGYNLYGTPARTYEIITLNNNGMVGGGKIDFLNSTIYSEDFIYYPDSVTADGYKGSIEPGDGFPQAELGNFRMYWLPRKDSMYLQTVGDPFSFYEGTAKLTGEANITQKGVYGSGTMLTRGSEAVSSDFAFKELSYSARNADFKVLTNDPEKPAMQGDDIRLQFDLVNNTADIVPERRGVASLSFPYAQMKTSIVNAKWFLEDSIITMTKPQDAPLENSYFYSTREFLDSLAFYGTQASYDIQTFKLKIEGIPYIEVADGRIVPDNNETTILENSKLQTFTNAGLEFEYPNATHKFYNGIIDIISRHKFSGKATYLLPVYNDTVEIEMRNFYQYEREVLAEKKKKKKDEEQVPEMYTVADGNVTADEKLLISAGFLYKGAVNLKVYKQALELVGYVKPDFQSRPQNNFWIEYSRTEDETDVKIDVETARYENGESLVAGIHYDINGELYATMVEQRLTPGDQDFFKPAGILQYNPQSKNFLIEEPGKSSGKLYSGDTYVYNDSTANILYEGNASFFKKGANRINVESSVIGGGNMKEGTFSVDALLAFDLNMPDNALSDMADDLIDIVTRLGNPPANDLELSTVTKIANFAGEEAARQYETESLKDYVALHSASPVFERSLLISGVKMEWSKEHKAWYNKSKLDLSNIFRKDINAKMDGFLELKKDETGGDIMNLFIQAAPGTWYYFNYQENSLLTYSSNQAFNEVIKEKSNFGESKPDELVLIAGEENETLKFLNEFRKNYYGIDEPYNLVYPDETSLKDESFETIEKDDDDGFGF